MTEGSRPSPKSAMKVVIFYFYLVFLYILHFRIFDNIRNFKWEGVV